jgi:NADPH:quinone reductase-like Zn-dependent oxidoreductase
MKAAVQTRYGPPEVVLVSEVDKPTARDNEVLVKVHATTVNRTDCACRAAKPFFMRLFTGLIRPRETVLGNEFAGVVEAVGGGVTSFVVGDKVFGYNEGPFGAHAEYMSIPEDGSLATMPANMTFQEAAPSTEGSHYALSHIKAAKIQSGQDVLVYGATGAIGSAAVQLLKSLGANVTGVCDTDRMELVKGLGADRVVDYTAGDFTRDEQKYDVVLDSVGKSSFSQCKRLLKPGGIYISSELGPLAQNPFLALIAPLHGGKKVMFPIPKHDQLMVRYFRELIESGEFKPVIDRTYPLDQIAEAYRYVETGQKTGNVVISLAGITPRTLAPGGQTRAGSKTRPPARSKLGLPAAGMRVQSGWPPGTRRRNILASWNLSMAPSGSRDRCKPGRSSDAASLSLLTAARTPRPGRRSPRLKGDLAGLLVVGPQCAERSWRSIWLSVTGLRM